jgi:predicted metalloprotease with PDZ domain
VLDEPGALGFTLVEEWKFLVVAKVEAKSQAEKQGLQPGSAILAANRVQFDKLGNIERYMCLKTEERPIKLHVLPPAKYSELYVYSYSSFQVNACSTSSGGCHYQALGGKCIVVKTLAPNPYPCP